jgi:hypothetical protein
MITPYTLQTGVTMTRVQIFLTEDQDRQLEALARRLRKSKTSLVRQGVDFVLHQRRRPEADALLDLIGQAGRVGRKDVSRRHDAYLLGLKPQRRR